ncbi:MAG: AbrB/MazE/SpoVT family DNA-binding domain-containing protein [Nitrososphaerota archaeon]|nr:AbrB/MazE/SpoVT family DNA-binding domain-containing protein [Nitrososphaerota archaeon]
MGEAVIDDRGRIVMPNGVREELNLRPEQRPRVVPKGRGLVLTPEIGAEEFIAELEGCAHRSRTVVRMHPEVDRSTLMDIIDQAGLTRDQFIGLQ